MTVSLRFLSQTGSRAASYIMGAFIFLEQAFFDIKIKEARTVTHIQDHVKPSDEGLLIPGDLDCSALPQVFQNVP